MRKMVRSLFFALNESQSGKIGNNPCVVSSDCQVPVWGEEFTVSIPDWINSEDLTKLPRVMYCFCAVYGFTFRWLRSVIMWK